MEYTKTKARVVAIGFGVLTIISLLTAVYFKIVTIELSKRIDALERKMEVKE